MGGFSGLGEEGVGALRGLELPPPARKGQVVAKKDDAVWEARQCIHCGAEAWFECGEYLLRCTNYADCGRYMIR